MLHHVIDWQAALGEGGPGAAPRWRALGYDLVASRPARWLHQAEGARHRLMAAGELRDRLAAVPVEAVRLRPGLARCASPRAGRRGDGYWLAAASLIPGSHTRTRAVSPGA